MPLVYSNLCKVKIIRHKSKKKYKNLTENYVFVIYGGVYYILTTIYSVLWFLPDQLLRDKIASETNPEAIDWRNKYET